MLQQCMRTAYGARSNSAWLQGCWAHADFGAILAVLTDEGDIAILEEACQHSNIVLREQARILHKGCRVLSFGPKEGGLQLASACRGSHIRCQCI